jgi:hypothetical protein
MIAALQIIHWLSALVVLAEALNKLERCSPCAAGLTTRQRLLDGLKAFAWSLLALGAGGGLIAPALQQLHAWPDDLRVLMRVDRPALTEAIVMLGVAALIIRTRIKEG